MIIRMKVWVKDKVTGHLYLWPESIVDPSRHKVLTEEEARRHRFDGSKPRLKKNREPVIVPDPEPVLEPEEKE